MKGKTRALALGGILTALTFVLCLVGSITASGKFIMPAICGILLMVIFRHISARVAVSVYVVSAVLLLLLPNRLSAFAYILLLGYYPILCEGLKKLPFWLQFVIKAAILTAVGCLILFLGAAMLGLWANETFTKYLWLMILGFYVLSGIYDLFLWLLRWQFDATWDKKLGKLLH